ncbi:MAG: RecQ family ATP-dependent DNA helicase [Bacteroidales bacterium]|nr:RecQ family ATP-dependent DNA helicase [Bacteroidales bacterium]
MSIYTDILKKYWGYDAFRPLQEEIIKSVADYGKDTLGLLPTGGGKSIIFQVPALSKSGVCIVVTPLIALMKDQVENLRRRNIKAAAIYSGMTQREIQNAYDSCIYGDVKFLYMSPERLGTEMFLQKIRDMEISILAIDEAHCISQWGYDFRPSYLRIADVRKVLPKGVPVLALTATATPEVASDIMDKLGFREPNLFRKSFARKNLIYIVRRVEDKNPYMLRIFNSQPGTGIVYVRNRKRTKEASEYLKQCGISSEYFHAGLTPAYKDYRQQQWKDGNIRVICSTNAFGMGIDKPDVRTVVHIDLPDSMEGYFQEAGRGGRDEKKAYAVLLYNDRDISSLRRNLTNSFPSKDFIKNVYNALGNYLQIPIGAGRDVAYGFNLLDFANKYQLNQLQLISALHILQRNGYIETTEEVFTQAKVQMLVSREDLYKFQVAQKAFDSFIKLLLRNHEGIFSNAVDVDEEQMARDGKCKVDVIYAYLNKLAQMRVISYIPQKNQPYIIYISERIDTKGLIIRPETYDLLREKYQQRINAMIKYCMNDQQCRSRQLTEYFGETDGEDCGECDVCRARKRAGEAPAAFNSIFDQVFALLRDNAGGMDIDAILDRTSQLDDSDVRDVVRKMMLDAVVEVSEEGLYRLVETATGS